MIIDFLYLISLHYPALDVPPLCLKLVSHNLTITWSILGTHHTGQLHRLIVTRCLFLIGVSVSTVHVTAFPVRVRLLCLFQSLCHSLHLCPKLLSAYICVGVIDVLYRSCYSDFYGLYGHPKHGSYFCSFSSW